MAEFGSLAPDEEMLLRANAPLGPVRDNDPLRNAVAGLRPVGIGETIRGALTLHRDEQGVPKPMTAGDMINAAAWIAPGFKGLKPARLPMDNASRLARAEQMGFRTKMPIAFGIAPEGERIASAALNVNGRIFTGPTHTQAMFNAERALGIPFEEMKHGPILDGFVTNTGRYVSRWEAGDIAGRGKQGSTGGIFGATEGLASEDTKMVPTAPSGKFNTGATAPGLPGGQGVWGYFGGEAPPGSQTLWHRTSRPAPMDVSGAAPHEIQAALKDAWEAGHDAVMLKNYSTPAGESRNVIVVRDPAQLRDPKAKFDPRKSVNRDVMAGIAGGVAIPLGMQSFGSLAPE